MSASLSRAEQPPVRRAKRGNRKACDVLSQARNILSRRERPFHCNHKCTDVGVRTSIVVTTYFGCSVTPAQDPAARTPRAPLASETGPDRGAQHRRGRQGRRPDRDVMIEQNKHPDRDQKRHNSRHRLGQLLANKEHHAPPYTGPGGGAKHATRASHAPSGTGKEFRPPPVIRPIPASVSKEA